MRTLAEAYPDEHIVLQLVAQIPWGHDQQLLTKLNFYVLADDDLLRHPDDQPTIGIVLCKSKDKTVAEYA